MLCNDFEQAIEASGVENLPDAAQAHASGCASCSALVTDFKTILSLASQIPAEVEPPARVWIGLRTQLEAEGIIRTPQAAVSEGKVPWWQGLGHLIRGHIVATASVAVLIVVAGFVPYVWHTGRTGEPQPQLEPLAATGTTLDQEEQSLGAMQTASTLGNTSSVDNSLRENLATVDAFIIECRKRLKEDPNDQMARDYLYTAYQQKAEILAAMMERGRSVN
jgi:hypothetical protein